MIAGPDGQENIARLSVTPVPIMPEPPTADCVLFPQAPEGQGTDARREYQTCPVGWLGPESGHTSSWSVTAG